MTQLQALLSALSLAVQAYADALPPTPTPELLISQAAIEQGIDPALAIRIATCESQLRQFGPDGKVLRGVQNPKDVGIFQVNEYYHLADSQKLGYDIHTLEGNIGYATWLMKNGGVKHWKWSEECWK